jgi:SNF2 family DNA or RNA helicase
MAALEALLRLRQAACHTALLPVGIGGKRVKKQKVRKELPADVDEDGNEIGGQPAPPPDDDSPESILLGSSKVTRLIAALEDVVAGGHKALVFSQWTSLLDLIEPHLNNAKIGFTRLDGSTKDRAAVVQEFQSEAGPPVILLSLKAGGTGLNLTAADHVFLVDPWWNPAVEEQAADRAHRIGQDRPVMVYRLVARDTVEERILVLQDAKRNLADAALGQADRATAITRDDLLALLA